MFSNSIIRTVFEGYDVEREGKIHINQLPSLLNKLGRARGKSSSDVSHRDCV